MCLLTVISFMAAILKITFGKIYNSSGKPFGVIKLKFHGILQSSLSNLFWDENTLEGNWRLWGGTNCFQAQIQWFFLSIYDVMNHILENCSYTKHLV